MNGWIGVDLDGTCALYEPGTFDHMKIGDPIPAMIDMIKGWLAEGREVRIFTARCYPLTNCKPEDNIAEALSSVNASMPEGPDKNDLIEALQAVGQIRLWCERYIGRRLAVTCMKDYAMLECYDDRAVQVERNTGKIIGYSTRQPPMVEAAHAIDEVSMEPPV